MKDQVLFHKDPQYESPLSNHCSYSCILLTISCSQYRAKVENGEIKITEEDFSSFLYPDDTRFDPLFPEKDSGKGHIFIRVS